MMDVTHARRVYPIQVWVWMKKVALIDWCDDEGSFLIKHKQRVYVYSINNSNTNINEKVNEYFIFSL